MTFYKDATGFPLLIMTFIAMDFGHFYSTRHD